MSEQKIKIENDSIKLGMLCLMFIAFNTCVSLIPVEKPHDTGKEQLIQAKKQYTLDSLRYEQTARFMEEYKLLKERELKIDSLAGVSAKKSANAQDGMYRLESEKMEEYVKAMRRASNGR